MKNILSYQPGTEFYGEEILAWAKYQVENNTSHKKQGEAILKKFSNINLNKKYVVYSSYRHDTDGSTVHKPRVQKEKV